MNNKFRWAQLPLSENFQTIYCDKEVLHGKGLKPQINDDCFCLLYYYVILKYSVFIFLDLKEMATVYF